VTQIKEVPMINLVRKESGNKNREEEAEEEE
jgi:hypothetical protein